MKTVEVKIGKSDKLLPVKGSLNDIQEIISYPPPPHSHPAYAVMTESVKLSKGADQDFYTTPDIDSIRQLRSHLDHLDRLQGKMYFMMDELKSLMILK